jgi:putative transposase
MPRPLRSPVGGVVYHVLNRANAGLRLFAKDADYEAFERIIAQARERAPLDILAYTLMPRHWHFTLQPPEGRGEHLSLFMKWLTATHAQRWHAHRKSVGSGHLYQGRFKSFPVQDDAHFLTVCRYVERNPLRAGLVQRAENWRWGSLWRRESGTPAQKKLLADWPMKRPPDWLDFVQKPATRAELDDLRRCINRGRPYGDPEWTEHTAAKLGLLSTLRSRGRPQKS